jgi:hypothetical protein
LEVGIGFIVHFVFAAIYLLVRLACEVGASLQSLPGSMHACTTCSASS